MSSRWLFLTGSGWNAVGWVLVLALVAFVASIAVVTVLVVQMPATYFTAPPPPRGSRLSALRWTLLVLKNLLGAVIVAAGVVMLVTPGQGILTILIGLALLDFPGKRGLERKLVSRPGVLGTINRLRARFGKPPLVLEEPQGQPGGGTPEETAGGRRPPPGPRAPEGGAGGRPAGS